LSGQAGRPGPLVVWPFLAILSGSRHLISIERFKEGELTRRHHRQLALEQLGLVITSDPTKLYDQLGEFGSYAMRINGICPLLNPPG